MRDGGFRNYANEWWHFTLIRASRSPNKRFDFPGDRFDADAQSAKIG